MGRKLIAKSAITINVPVPKVWDALINPATIKQYMFGTDVTSEWIENSPIIWKGIWNGKPYDDKGVILKIVPEKTLQYTHFSPLSGVPDVSENYHTVTYELESVGIQTRVLLSQDNNLSEEDRQHSQQMWDTILTGFKELLENKVE